MATWSKQKKQEQKTAPVDPVGPDCAVVWETGPAPEPKAKPEPFIQAGQVWEGVKVPDRPVNIMSLTPGATLPPFVIDGPFEDGTGHWCAGFVGERGTKIRVDEEMLKTGRKRP